MFHVANNLFFGRLENGDVRILQLRSTPKEWPTVDTMYVVDEFMMDVKIPANSWGSVIATLSRTGESHYNEVTMQHKWYAAMDFHNS